jgi:hypothetical protein
MPNHPVLIKRVRSQRQAKQCVLQGDLIGTPAIGERLFVVGEFGAHLVTSAVVRILETHEPRGMYVETENSVYHLETAQTRYHARRVGVADAGGARRGR